MYRMKLEIDGYLVDIARDGEEGVRQAISEVPDLIFLDIRLPHLDGFQVLEELRSHRETKDVPVVILSNYGESDQVERGLKLGALEYLIKADTPPSRLVTDVEKWTGGPP